MGDDALKEWLGERAFDALTRRAQETGSEYRLRDSFDNGGTQAKVAVVEQRRRRRSRLLVLKLDRFSGTDFSESEYSRHRLAAENTPKRAARYLARQAGSPIAVDDEWSITLQQIAGDLDQFQPLSSLIRGFLGEGPPLCRGQELAGVLRSVVSGVLGKWSGDPKTGGDAATVPEYLRMVFDYRLRAGKPLVPLVRNSLDPAFRLIQDPALTAGIEVFPLIGRTHGDMHVENVLIRIAPLLQPEDFRLIDLANYQEPGPVARDPAHLLVHLVNRALPRLSDIERAALPATLLDPRSPQSDLLPRWLSDVISQMYEAGEQWVANSGFEADWRRDRPLALYAAALMVYVRSTTRPEDKQWLLDFATSATETFLSTAKPRPGRAPAGTGAGSLSKPMMEEASDEKYVVGRDAEAAMFHNLLLIPGKAPVVNIYGVGGMGKTVVGRKLARQARADGVPVADADVSDYGNNPRAVLRHLSVTLAGTVPTTPLMDYIATVDAHDTVHTVVDSMGGVDAMFQPIGSPTDVRALQATLDACEPPLPRTIQEKFTTRFGLESFLRASEKQLAAAFGEMLGAALDGAPGALILDTYEEVGTLDRWVRGHLLKNLPPTTRVVILGRNELPKQTLDWEDHADAISLWPLPELSRADAERYLRKYGLTDARSLNEVLEFTGGYPLLLMLVRRLAWQNKGWQAIGALENAADRDQIAGKLLERILREERVAEVRAVLEKCCVATWINPEIIEALLGVSPGDARILYDKARQHSFMDEHPEGARLHDKIRELLQDRLRFTSGDEYDQLKEKLLAYHAGKTRGGAAGRDRD